MDRIQGEFAVDNRFDDGDETTGREATDLNAAFMNHVQEELCGAVEGSGQTLDPDDDGQLARAISLRGFHVFDGASAALDADTGLPSGNVRDAIVVLHNAAGSTSVSGFTFPAPESCVKLGTVIVIPDWSGAGAGSSTASCVINQSSGGSVPVYNGNVFVAAFDGTGAISAAFTAQIPYRGTKTFGQFGQVDVQSYLHCYGAGKFDGALQVVGALTGSSLNISGNLNSAGYIEIADAIGNAVAKPFLVNGFHYSDWQRTDNGATQQGLKRATSFITRTGNVDLTTNPTNLGAVGQRLAVYNASDSSIQVTYKSGVSPLFISAGCCCEFVRVSGTTSTEGYVWAPMTPSVS